jgi:hypothetical protein
MRFDAILAQVLDLLQRQGRVSYRALKRRFDLDDAYLEDLKAEIIKAQRLAIDWVDPSLLPPGGTRDPRAGRGRHRARERTGVSAVVDHWDAPTGLGTGDAGAGRGGERCTLQRRYTGSRGSCCCARPSLTRHKSRPVCTRLSISPATSRPGRGSCERQ